MSANRTRSATGARELDVVVVGLGFAGLTTAITAHDAGARVVILEKMSEERSGGTSRVSGQLWFCPTSADQAARYLRNLNGSYTQPVALVNAWADEIATNTTWMTGIGAQVGIGGVIAPDGDIRPGPPEFPEVEGHECDPGWYHLMPDWGHSRLWLFLRDAVRRRGIEVLYETRARDLVQEGGKREVVGVRAERGGASIVLHARRGVVLASGGFSNEPQMAQDFLGLPSICPNGSPGGTGDGIKMAEQAGADLWHMTDFQGRIGLKAPEYPAGFEIAMPASGWIYVDADGRRFLSESVPARHGKRRKGSGFITFPSGLFHCVFDDTTRRAGPIQPPLSKVPTTWNRIIEGYVWSEDNSVEIERGWVKRAQTLRELARQIDVDPTSLERSVERYNAHCAVGSDPDFARDPATLAPVVQPPFYAWTWGNLVVQTCGGPRKDEHARVLNPAGAPIPRLYCAGEVSSSYSWLYTGGQMIGDAMAFGRIAGRRVAQESIS